MWDYLTVLSDYRVVWRLLGRRVIGQVSVFSVEAIICSDNLHTLYIIRLLSSNRLLPRARHCRQMIRQLPVMSAQHDWHTVDDQKKVLWSYSVIISWNQKILLSVDSFLLVAVVTLIDYSDMDKMMDTNNNKC